MKPMEDGNTNDVNVVPHPPTYHVPNGIKFVEGPQWRRGPRTHTVKGRAIYQRERREMCHSVSIRKKRKLKGRGILGNSVDKVVRKGGNSV